MAPVVLFGRQGAATMATDGECMIYACSVRLAGLTDDTEIRHRLMEMARSWIAMAEGEGSTRNANV
jgi:hypothetical protein